MRKVNVCIVVAWLTSSKATQRKVLRRVRLCERCHKNHNAACFEHRLVKYIEQRAVQDKLLADSQGWGRGGSPVNVRWSTALDRRKGSSIFGKGVIQIGSDVERTFRKDDGPIENRSARNNSSVVEKGRVFNCRAHLKTRIVDKNASSDMRKIVPYNRVFQ